MSENYLMVDYRIEITYLRHDKQMTDTPRHIKELQLKLWLSKSPMERLKLTLESNGELLHFWSSAHVVDRKLSNQKPMPKQTIEG